MEHAVFRDGGEDRKAADRTGPDTLGRLQCPEDREAGIGPQRTDADRRAAPCATALSTTRRWQAARRSPAIVPSAGAFCLQMSSAIGQRVWKLGKEVLAGLSVHENNLVGAYHRRKDKADIAEDLEGVYSEFPRLKARYKAPANWRIFAPALTERA